ncbi:hypothetical protein GE061_008604 [Apolygus lucorum]|uniref:Uncharacterized protein n=1 Tax=Apolygus lucorum TaxID=248454 RepID=A0A8S9WN37_APOLU|nr:hypothetical protein GE061_008604 [Apolygus lucorum]
MEGENVVREEATEDEVKEEVEIKQEVEMGDEDVEEEVGNGWAVEDEVEGDLMIKREDDLTDPLGEESDVLEGSSGVQRSFNSQCNHGLSRNEVGEKLHGGPSVLEGAGRREGACARSGDAAGGATGGGGGNFVAAGADIGGEPVDRERARFMEEEEVERTVIRSGGTLRID